MYSLLVGSIYFLKLIKNTNENINFTKKETVTTPSIESFLELLIE